MSSAFKLKKRIICLLCALLVLPLFLAGCSSRKQGKTIKNTEDLNGSVISVEMGTTHAAIIKKTPALSDCEINYAYTSSDGVASLLSGKSDAYVTDYVMALSITKQYDSLIMLDETLDNAKYGFGFRKGDRLIKKFNAEMKSMNADDRIQELFDKWTGLGEKTLPEQDWNTINGTVICGVDPDVEPLCYLDKNGNITGLDVELILMVAEKLKVKVEFVNVKFDDLEASLLSEQVDMIASGISITDERLERYDFTDGYLDAGSVAVIRKADVDTTGQGFILTVKNSVQRSLIDENRWLDMIKGLGTTALISIFSFIAGTIIGIGMFLLAYFSKYDIHRIFEWLLKLHTLLPITTWLLICYYLIFPGQGVKNTFVALFTFTISFSIDAYSIFDGSIRGIPQSQTDAAYSMGYSKFEAVYKIYLPQAFPGIIASMQTVIIYLVRDSSVVGYVSVQDIQAVADAISLKTSEPFIPIIVTAIFYIAYAFVLSRFVTYIAKKFAYTERTEAAVKKKIMRGWDK
ncbi:MAG: transporter substrate-binding domain-containing protein [Clostridiales bacterium]|nr:transporter substrate-binding domain-containing protein [Candidatus Equinaster intestinalis]